MKRAEWPNCQTPREMLHALLKAKKSGRKFRLFACACCRCVWHLLSDPRSREAVETAEGLADGLVSDRQASEAYKAAAAVNSEAVPSGSSGCEDARGVSQASLEAAQAFSVTLLNYETPEHAQWHASIVSYQTITAASLAEAQAHPAGVIADYARNAAELREGSAQAGFLRCIFGFPFRPVTIAPSILTWHDRTIPRLAQAIYEDRQLPAGTFDPARMNILADALLDAGCDNEDIIQHCRSDKPHVRGCWVVDLILGRE